MKPLGRFFVADPGLVDGKGHHYATSSALHATAAERGVEARILGNRRYQGPGPVTPVFRRSLYEPREAVRPPLETALRSGPLVDRNALDLIAHAEEAGTGAADLYFFHTASVDLLASLLDYFVLVPPERLASHHFLFRYDPEVDRWAGGPELLREVTRRLRALDLIGRRVFLYAETEALARFHAETSGCPVTTLHHFSICRATMPRNVTGPVRIGYFGEARLEKGFDAYQQALDGVLDRLNGRAHFVTQAYISGINVSPEMAAAQAFFQGPRYARAGELFEILDEEAYEREVAAAEVLVIPHRTPIYARRGSGIFVDAVVGNKLIVVREGTWMAAISPPEHVVTFAGDEALGGAIERAVERAEARRRSAATPNGLRPFFDVSTNVQEVLRNHMAGGAAAAGTRPLRVLHIAPFWLRQGSTRVYEAQLRLLREIGATVMCVSIANFHVEAHPTEGTYRWFLDQAPSGGAVHQWLVAAAPAGDAHGASVTSRLLGKPNSWLREWVQAHSLEIPATLARAAQDGGFDLVVLNYAHNLPLVRRLGLEGVPVIVETHDIRARQFAGLGTPEAARLDAEAELAALGEAAGLVFINADEASAVSARVGGTPSITVLPALPGLLDDRWVRLLREGGSAARWALLRAVAERAIPDGRALGGLCDFLMEMRRAEGRPRDLICFLGSAHHWNMVSLEWLHDQVFVPYLLPQGIRLVIAGRAGSEFAASRGRQPGVIMLGELEDVSLLYESGMTFVLPVRGGSGFPIKTLEALLAGNPVVGTREAFRGFPSLARVARVADDPHAFAGHVLALRNGEAERPAPARELPAVMSWEHYRREWARLVERVTGRRMTLGPPEPPAARAAFDAAELAAEPPLVPLELRGAWRFGPATRKAFLAASRGFAPTEEEEDYCWSGENFLCLALRLEEPARSLRMTIESVFPQADGTAAQPAHILVDGRVAGHVVLEGSSTLVLPISDPDAASLPVNILVEMVLPAVRPGMAADQGGDPRRLGFTLTEIELSK